MGSTPREASGPAWYVAHIRPDYQWHVRDRSGPPDCKSRLQRLRHAAWSEPTRATRSSGKAQSGWSAALQLHQVMHDCLGPTAARHFAQMRNFR